MINHPASFARLGLAKLNDVLTFQFLVVAYLSYMAGAVEIVPHSIFLPVVRLPDYSPEEEKGFPPDLNHTIDKFGEWINYPFSGRFGVKLVVPTKVHAPQGGHVVGWFRKTANPAYWADSYTEEFFRDKEFHESFSGYLAEFYENNPDNWVYMMLGYAPPGLPSKPWLYERAHQSQLPIHCHFISYPADGKRPEMIPDDLINQVPHILNISGEAASEKLLSTEVNNKLLELVAQGEIISRRQTVDIGLSPFSAIPEADAIFNSEGLSRTFLGFGDFAQFCKAYRDTIRQIETDGDMGLAWYEEFSERVIDGLNGVSDDRFLKYDAEIHDFVYASDGKPNGEAVKPVSFRIGKEPVVHQLPRVFGGELNFVSPQFRRRWNIPDNIKVVFRPFTIDGPLSLILPQGPIIHRRFSAS